MTSAFRSLSMMAATWAVLVLLPESAPGQEGASLALFDGKSLENWTRTDFANAGPVEVVDGVIRLAKGRSMTGITTTRKDLPRINYELSYEAMRTGGEDFFAAATFPVGKSHVTLVNGGWGGNVTGLSSIGGADASENETTTSFTYKNDTWYTFRVRVTERRIRCWVGEKMVVDVEVADRHLDTRLETYANQPLGFACWETSSAIRKIELRNLTAEEVAEMNKSDE